MPHPQVLCLGEILYDRIADHVASSIQHVSSWTNYVGGAPANVACALSKLGTESGFIGAIGNDPIGQALVTQLSAEGVNPTGIQRIATHPTRTVLVLRSTSGERTFAAFGDQRATTDFADTQLEAAHLPQSRFKTAKFLVLGSLAMATPKSHDANLQAIKIAHQSGNQVFLDVNWRPVFWPQPAQAKSTIAKLIQQVDWLKLSIEESKWLLGHHNPHQIIQQFPQLQGVFITLGPDGCDYWLRGHHGKAPALAVIVQDTTGAGDGFVAGLLHQLCRTESVSSITAQAANTIVTYACAVGSLTTTQLGAINAQPTAAQVQQLLNQTER
ncbi:carbohydrate kinase [filamentous cyanobacterium LEGE 11480]|uniref:Carbohydrate kinase n=1 Tax=Romeriopsis navalis LEGE 11480 TaxID=2777977 RepID=A0A928Z3V0_9CYAN|nr:carbohydrate kinase [Romeriopsis navalis]MBE9029660.1 carbohydrate kinase [Romeriopsis navalis LEGE 11480]